MIRKNSGDYNFSVKTKRYGDDIEYVVLFDDFPNLIGAGETIEEAIEEARNNLDVYINYCYENSIPVPEPTRFEFKQNIYSGKVTLRMSKSLHERATNNAEKEGVSLNSFVNEAIAFYISSLEKASIQDLFEKYQKLTPDRTVCFIHPGEMGDLRNFWTREWKEEKTMLSNFTKINFSEGGMMVIPSPQII